MTPSRWLVPLAVLNLAVFARAGERAQGRSMVISRNGVVAAESPLAAQAGVRILEAGGNAIDAAIATNAVMGVVEPMANGLGGDLFALVYDAKSKRLYGLNASGWAPQALTIARLRGKNLREMPERGIDSVTVPGVVQGWGELSRRFGSKSLGEDLAAAIRTAREGFPVPEWTAQGWAPGAKRLAQDEGAAATYLIAGKAPALGQVFRNPDLARSLTEIAAGGPDAFYRGPIGRRILELTRRKGGAMTAEDLADYRAEWAEPISTTYRGWTVYEMRPNSQGLGALMMLNIMERFPLRQEGLGSAAALHTMIEAKKLAYADLRRYVGDPRAHAIPVDILLSKAWAAKRAELIDPEHARAEVAAAELRGGSDTEYLCVVDRDGNMVSLIQSNYEGFGSGLVAPGTGFVLQNRGALFTLDESSPNALAGHKRPLHTIIPAFMERGSVRIAFGIMGGWNQSQAHAQFVADIADFGLNIQAAMEEPRFTKLTFSGNDVQIENRFGAAVFGQLKAKGHLLEVHGPFYNGMGGGQAVMRDFSAGVNYGASDPRKDGEAIPEMPDHGIP